LLLARDAFAQLDDASMQALEPAIRRLSSALGLEAEPVEIAPEGFETYYWAFRRIQAREVWRCHGEWITRVRPHFGPGVRERFAAAEQLSGDQAHKEQDEATRAALTDRCRELLADDAVLLLPPAAGPAPFIDDDPSTLENFRERTLRLTCLSPLARIPQLAFPAATVDGAPIGLSLAARHGADELLLASIREA
jgi:amidase